MPLDFAELKAFIAIGMRMQHIYQPVMIKTLLESRKNKASVRQIAEQFLQRDESQIEYYMQITRAMPGKVLARHGIVTYDKDARSYVLNVEEELTPSRRIELIALCESKVDEYEKARGRLIWLHRIKDPGYVPGSLRYQVLKKAKFRCELCGVSAEEKALDVDHIVPRNRGGKTVIENLQTLCYTCNSQKRDLDDTDFRPWKALYDDRKDDCIFCSLEASRIMSKNTLALAFEDKYPVTEGHMLVSPVRHVQSYFELGSGEHKACFNLLEEMKLHIAKKDSTVTGFNIGVNDGRDAGQTVLHCHIHLIPRRKGDVADPRGGIRHVIPNRGFY
jgi:ATP adenylyltransferase